MSGFHISPSESEFSPHLTQAFQLSTCINQSLKTSYCYKQKWLASFRKYLYSSKAHINDRCEHNLDIFDGEMWKPLKYKRPCSA